MTSTAALVHARKPQPQTYPEPPVYQVVRTATPVVVDGDLSDPAWTGALRVKLGFETQPAENAPAPVETEFLITYDTSYLYLGFHAFDPDPAAIRAHVCDRDHAFRNDFVGIIIDTFNDKRRGYEFFSNPLGVQMDLSRNEVNGSNEDDTWDAIWASAGKIVADGYQVEMAIPFSSLRFPRTAGEQAWRIAPFRAYPRNVRHQITAVPLDRSNNCFFCQVPQFVGFEGIRPGRDIELDPTLTTERTDAVVDEDDISSEFREGSFDTEAGLSARWGVTPNLSLNAALNPDFSQVEADAAQLATNTRYALFFPEKRPFFLEGADFFSTPISAVYTRTVADPSWGLKLSGKEGDNAVGVYVAQDRTTNVLFPSNAGSDLDSYDLDNTAAVVRYRRDIGSSSAVGVLATDREGDGYFNRVFGLDGMVRASATDTFRLQILGSRTRYTDQMIADYDQPEGELAGSALLASWEHDTRDWNTWVWHERYSTGFRADAGFVPRVDAATTIVGGQRNWIGEKGDWYTRISVGSEPWQTKDHTGRVTDEAIPVYANFDGPLQSTVRLRYARAKEYYEGVTYDQDRYYFFVNVRPTGSFTCSLDTKFGDTVDYDNSRPATVNHLAPGITWDLGRHLYLQVDHVFEDLDVAGGRLYRANLTQARLVYQFNTRSFVRAIVQRLDVRRNLDLYVELPDSARTQSVFSQLMFSYKLNPQTVFFLGYSDTREGDDQIDRIQTNRTVFAKLGYAWLM